MFVSPNHFHRKQRCDICHKSSKCDNRLTTFTINRGLQEQIKLLNEGLDNFSPFLSKDGAIKQAYLPNHLTDNAVHPSRFLRF